MKAAFLPDRGVVRISGETARSFLNGLLTGNIGTLAPGGARYAALLTPQGKIIVDGIVTEAPADDGGGFFFDCPRALAPACVDRLTVYKLRAKVTLEDLSDRLGVMAVWDGEPTASEYGLLYPDPRLPALGSRAILPPQVASDAAADMKAALVDAAEYEAHRILLGVPRGGLDFIYGDAFPHEADMDQLSGVDFKKGCYVGQEVVSRTEHRGIARSRVVPVLCEGGSPEAGLPVMAGEKPLGTMGSSANGRGLALIRLDRAEEALAAGQAITAGGVALTLAPLDWARFAIPGQSKAAG
jgi:folate-binding protein YgfZ